MNQATIDFIHEHAEADVRQLALQGTKNPEVDLTFALEQIAGRQKAKTKLPSWAAVDGIVYPPHLSMEQCSSEQTARYKALIAGKGALIVDLTAGFGVDMAFMSQGFQKAIYVERQAPLCAISSENYKLLGLNHIEVICADGIDYLHQLEHADLIFLDPARRDDHGARTYGIADCTPNVLELRDELLKKADRVMLKLSPMLDWRKAVEDLGHVNEVHIVSVDNECKELLLILSKEEKPLKLFCVNNDQVFEGDQGDWLNERSIAEIRVPVPMSSQAYLFEPNASIMKAGTIEKTTSMNKRELKTALAGIDKANITVRNFPLSVAELRKRLKLKDGGNLYLFATTLADGQHQLFLCRKTE